MLAMLVISVGCLAADFAGTWKGESKGKKKSVDVVLDLKSDGGTWSGTLAQGKRGRGVALKDVTVAGEQVTFSVVRKTKKGDRTLAWTGMMKDGGLELTQGRGKKRSDPIVLKRD